MLASLCVTLQIKALSRTSLKPNRQVWQWRVDSWVSPSRGAEPVTRGSVELCSSKLQAPTSDQPTEHHHSAGRCGDSRSREAVLHDVIEWPWVTLRLLVSRSTRCLDSPSSCSIPAGHKSSWVPSCTWRSSSRGTRASGVRNPFSIMSDWLNVLFYFYYFIMIIIISHDHFNNKSNNNNNNVLDSCSDFYCSLNHFQLIS